jgi:hypothetical protein
MKVYIITSLLVVMVFFAVAQALTTDDGAKECIEKSIEALGGQKNLTGWNTRVSKGLLQANRPGWGNLRAACTYYIQKPDKLVLDQDYSAYDHPFFFRYTFNAGDAWVMVNLGVRQSPRYTSMLDRSMRTVNGLAYYIENCDTFFTVTELPEDSLLAATDYRRVGIVDNGDTVYFDIDKETHLPVRSIDKGSGGAWNHKILEDYRTVGNIKVPFHTTTYSGGAKIQEMKWDSIGHDVVIDPAIFEEDRPKPSGE